MENAKGFWSYVHDDDDAEGGRIVRLAYDIQSEYEMITAEKIKLFVDKDGLDWGSEWRKGIDASLATTAYFIPVITPRFFRSVECRRELNSFSKQASRLGVQDLIMPILYVRVPELEEEETGDELMDIVKSYQWEDWTDLRFAATDSPDYRRAVARLASMLAEKNRRLDDDRAVDVPPVLEQSLAATAPSAKLKKSPSEADDDDAPGDLDAIATMEAVLPEWTQTIQDISDEITAVGSIFTDGTEEINNVNKKYARVSEQVSVFKKIAKQLNEPAENITELSSKFNSQLYDLDLGVRAIINNSKSNPYNNNQPLPQDFLQSLNELDNSVGEGLGSLEDMLSKMLPLEAMSRDLKKPLRKMRKGLTLILEGREVIKEWVKLAEA